MLRKHLEFDGKNPVRMNHSEGDWKKYELSLKKNDDDDDDLK